MKIVKIIAGIICCAGIVTVAQIKLSKLLTPTSFAIDERMLLIGIVVAILSIGNYILLFKYYGKEASQNCPLRLGKNLSIGILRGLLLQSLTILLMQI